MPKPTIKKEVYYKKENPKTHERKKATTAPSRARTVEQERQKHEDRLEERRGRKPKHVYTPAQVLEMDGHPYTEAKVLEMDGHPYQEPEFLDVDDDILGDHDDEIHSKILPPPSPIHDEDGVDDEAYRVGGFYSNPERDDSSSSDEEDLKGGKTGSRTQTLVAAAPSDPDDPDDGGSKTMLVDDLSNADLKGKQQMAQYVANLRYYEGEQLETLKNDMISVYHPVQVQVDAFKAIDFADLRRGIDLLKGQESVPRVKVEELEAQYHHLVENRNYIVQEVDDIQKENNQLIKVAIDPIAADQGKRAFRGDLQADRKSILDWIKPRALKVCMAASEGLKAGFSLASAIGSAFSGEFVGAITKGVEFGSHVANLVKVIGTNLEQTEQLRQELYGVGQNTQAMLSQQEQSRKQFAELTERQRRLEADIAINNTTLDAMKNQRETLAIEWRKNNDDINNNMQLIQTNGVRTQEQLAANSQSLVAIQGTLNQVIPAVRNVGKVVSLVNSISKNLKVVNDISTRVIQNMPTNAQQEAFFNQMQASMDGVRQLWQNAHEQYQQLVHKSDETTAALSNQVIRAVGNLENRVVEYARAHPENNQRVIQHINAANASLRRSVVEDLSKQLQNFVDASGKVNSNQLSTVVYKTDETALARFNELVQRRLDGLQTSVLEKISANQVVIPAPIEQNLGVKVDEVINIMKGFPDAMAALQEYVSTRQMAIEARQEATNRLLLGMQDAITSMITSNKKAQDEFLAKLPSFLPKYAKDKFIDLKFAGDPANRPLAAIRSAYDVTDPSGIINPDNLRRMLNLIDRLSKGLIFDLPYAIVTKGLNLPPTTTDEELYRHFKSLREQGAKMSTRTHGRVYIGGKHIDPFIQPDYNEKREKEIRTNRLRKIEKRQKKDEADMYGGFFKLL